MAGKDDNASAAEGGSEKALENEIESLTGILSDLEKKVNRINSVDVSKKLMIVGVMTSLNYSVFSLKT